MRRPSDRGVNWRPPVQGQSAPMQNLNLNGLLVTRQIDNTSPGGAPGGKLFPGSHKRCELGHTVIRHFSRGDIRHFSTGSCPEPHDLSAITLLSVSLHHFDIRRNGFVHRDNTGSILVHVGSSCKHCGLYNVHLPRIIRK